jgi:hypothetical protein
MEANKKIVAVIGLGNIGKRHVQSLLSLECYFTILIVENDRVKFDRFYRDFYREINENDFIEVNFSDNLFSGLTVDVCIVATQNTFRHDIIEFLNTNNKIISWILEKPLSNSLESLAHINSSLQDCKATYVNLTRETMDSYIKFKSDFTEITGNGWGLASNAIHFLRLLEWLYDSKFLNLYFEGSNQLIATKRENFFDLRSKLVGFMSNGAIIELVDSVEFNRIEIKFSFLDSEIFIYEEESALIFEDLLLNVFTLELQSNLTSNYVKDLITSGYCKLPTLRAILDLERMLLIALYETNLYDIEEKVVKYT